MYYASGPTTRNVPNLVRNLHLGVDADAAAATPRHRHHRRRRRVPFAWVGELVGARVVYIESLTRIEKPSGGRRLIRPVADRLYVQWPELVRSLPRARYPGTCSGSRDPRHDRNERGALRPPPFARSKRSETRSPSSSSTAPPRCAGERDLCRPRVVCRARQAPSRCASGDTVRRHRTILVALANGKRPLVVPRLARFREAVDDHQLEFGGSLTASASSRSSRLQLGSPTT